MSSSSDSSPSPEPETPSTARIFQVNRTSYSKHYDIVSSTDGQIVYYAAQDPGYSKTTPDLVLHSAPNRDGPVVAVSYMFRLERGFKLGFGDPASDDAVEWEEMTVDTRSNSEHTFYASVGLVASGSGGDDKKERRRRRFVWKRTHSAEVLGEKPKTLSMRNFKLLDGDTAEVLAFFVNKPSYTACGTLQINVDRGKEFDVVVLITLLTIYEKSKRRAHGAPIFKDKPS